MTENLCQTCGSPRVPSNHEWICLTPNCALRLIKELQGDKKALAFKAHQRRVAAEAEQGAARAEVREARIGHDCALVAAYESGHRAGQEAMRERCADLVDRAADAACECDGTLCGPDDVAPHDEDCRRFDLDDLADAIRALEVSHD